MNLGLGMRVTQRCVGGGLADGPPINTAAPVVTGTPLEGETLAASTGTWLRSPTSYAYQWNRDGSPIGGATGSTYALATADVGADVAVTVTATNDEGSADADSAPVGPVAPAQPSVITSFPVGVPGGQQPLVHVRDVTNGYDLYTKGADTLSEFPASCVKMMTALLAHEYHADDWDSGTVTLSAADVSQPIAGLPVDMAGFGENDVVTWEALAYGALLPSGADACQGIARAVGDELYAAAGNTGTQGVARFVERMNARAAELDMDGTFADCFGGSKTFSPDTVRNTLSARDVSKLCAAAMAVPALRAISGTATRDVAVGGLSPRTLSLANTSRFVNGPFTDPSGIKDANVAGGKHGRWDAGAATNNNMSLLWVSPAGYEVVVTVLQSVSPWGMMLDVQGLLYSLERDFPYLSEASAADAHWAQVKLLVGGDGAVVDESTAGRALTASGVTTGSPVNATAGGLVFDASSDQVSAADAAALQVGSADYAAEVWYAGDGTVPAGEVLWFGKLDPGQREWTFDYNAGLFQVFESADGSNWTGGIAWNVTAQNGSATFFNGAPRHLARVREGGTVALYLNGERLTGTISVLSTFDGTAPVTIGYNSASALGRYDDFRLTIGAARYSAKKVTVPAAKLPRS